MNLTQAITMNRLLFRLLFWRLFLPLSLITLATLTVGAFWVERNLEMRQLQLTRSLAYTVDSYLSQTSRVLKAIAQVAEESDSEELMRYMRATWRGYGYFDTLYHLDENGRILKLIPFDSRYAGLDMSRQFYFQATRDQTNVQISRPFISPRTGQPTVYLAWPLQTGGVIVGELNLGNLQQVIANASYTVELDTVFITDEAGFLLAHPDFEKVAQQTNVGHLTVVQNGRTAETTLLYRNDRGLILTSATPVHQTNWVVIAEVPLQTVYLPVVGPIAATFLLSVLAWILIAWNLKYQFNRQVSTPLGRLRQGADALAAGEFDQGKDLITHLGELVEITSLGTNFQQMSQAIRVRQAALQESERQLRLILQNMPVMLIAFDENNHIIVWNRECEQVTGYLADEIMNDPQAVDWLFPHGGILEPNIMLRNHETEIYAKNDQNKTITWSTISAQFPVPGWKSWGVGVDITERKRLEEQLRQSQKMEAIGQLAGGVAHDFNNLLTVIISYTDLILYRLSTNDPTYNRVLEIQKAGQRAATLTQQLLAFSRKQILQPKILFLNHILLDMQELLQRLIGEDIKLNIVPAQDLGPVLADPGQMQQVVMNLAVNGRDAMPDGGILTLKTANVELRTGDIVDDAEFCPGSYVLLSVTDTGIGMNEQTLAHLFEPFFTTKGVGKGTGLGLATVHGIIKQSGGFVDVLSKPGRGTTFQVYLPRVDAPVFLDTPQTLKSVGVHGSETILLVEDEDVVRSLASHLLQEQGYRVLQASDGAAAIQVSESYMGNIDLLLTDVVMPGGMNGRQLAEYLIRRYPRLQVIYMSGYTDSDVLRRDVSSKDRMFLPKPFTLDGLLHKVREAFDKP